MPDWDKVIQAGALSVLALVLWFSHIEKMEGYKSVERIEASRAATQATADEGARLVIVGLLDKIGNCDP